MVNEKPGAQVAATSNGGANPAAEARTQSTTRAGQSSAPEGAARTSTLVILISERPGAVDRVVGLLRRRRAHMQTLTISRSEQPDIARITAVTNDSDVAVEQLVEQMRKVVDVRQVTTLASEHMVERELALIKVHNDPQRANEIIEIGQQFGAYLADIAPETVTFEVSGSTAKVEQLVLRLQPYGIREMARTGSVAMPRGTTITGAE